jgi:small-conductance mechanosensitive channel
MQLVAIDAQPLECAILMAMDHLEVLREKIGRLRDEIAHLQELNDEYRRAGSRDQNETEAQIAHGQRHERLQAIQQELAQLADLGRRVLSVEQRKEEHRSRLHLVKKAS